MTIGVEDIKSLDDSALSNLADAIRHEADTRARESRRQAVKAVRDIMAEHNLTAADLTDTTKGQRKDRPSKTVKYRHPTDERTWSGNGRKPEWMTTYLAEGGTLESLLIDKPEHRPLISPQKRP